MSLVVYSRGGSINDRPAELWSRFWAECLANEAAEAEKLRRYRNSKPPKQPSLCWDVKVGWVPVRDIDPATGRPYTGGPGTEPRKE